VSTFCASVAGLFATLDVALRFDLLMDISAPINMTSGRRNQIGGSIRFAGVASPSLAQSP
jgi:hypothetical protein